MLQDQMWACNRSLMIECWNLWRFRHDSPIRISETVWNHYLRFKGLAYHLFITIPEWTLSFAAKFSFVIFSFSTLCTFSYWHQCFQWHKHVSVIRERAVFQQNVNSQRQLCEIRSDKVIKTGERPPPLPAHSRFLQGSSRGHSPHLGKHCTVVAGLGFTVWMS